MIIKSKICGADAMSCSDRTYICPKGHINTPTYEPQNCDMPLPQSFGVRYGWICPRCGKVNSPDARSCDCSSGGVTITTGSTITIPDDIKISLSGIITGGSAPEAHFDKAVYADGGTVTTDCKINPEDFSTTTNDNSVVTFDSYTTARNNK